MIRDFTLPAAGRKGNRWPMVASNLSFSGDVDCVRRALLHVLEGYSLVIECLLDGKKHLR